MPKKSKDSTVKDGPKGAVEDTESTLNSMVASNSSVEKTITEPPEATPSSATPPPKPAKVKEEKKPIVFEPSHFKDLATWLPTLSPKDQAAFANFQEKLVKEKSIVHGPSPHRTLGQ